MLNWRALMPYKRMKCANSARNLNINVRVLLIRILKQTSNAGRQRGDLKELAVSFLRPHGRKGLHRILFIRRRYGGRPASLSPIDKLGATDQGDLI